jgi:hypothetical protein
MKHRENIKRIFAGTEPKIGKKESHKKKWAYLHKTLKAHLFLTKKN